MRQNTRKSKKKARVKPSKDYIHSDINDGTSPSMREERFAAAETRPQFIVPKPNASKVVLDDRFSSVLTDSRFRLQEKDKYGRKKKKKNAVKLAKEELESFYVVGNQEENAPKNEETKSKVQNENNNGASDTSVESSDERNAVDHVSRIAYLTAFSRGEVDASSSSGESDSSESSDDDDSVHSDEDLVCGVPGVFDPSTKEIEEIELSYDLSPYIVVTNMDWENVRAVDLFCILSSFAPPGAIKKVQVFQSDFGIEQMAKDKLYGPTGIWQKKKTNKEELHSWERSSDVEDDDQDSIGSQGSNENESKFDKQDFSKESDFDPEKLRAYEASKLKYYFAVTEVSQPEYADIIYREVDGMEFEHSSTAIDLRTLPQNDYESVITDRPMRDEATSIPGKYEPPDFIVSALQQTKVQCTWDQGDKERERKLTNYGSSKWQESFEADDLKAYLASDCSSDEDSDENDDEKVDKKSMMRKALGLDSDRGSDVVSSDNESTLRTLKDNEDEKGMEEDVTMSKEIKILPDKKHLEERIRSKLDPKEKRKELTPWEKYQEKRKQKRKERRQVVRGNKNSENSTSQYRSKDTDVFFESENESIYDSKSRSKVRKNSKERNNEEQLELLMAGEYAEEETRDYDIRGIQRLEKNKGKKLTGSRKRKEAKIAEDVSGSNFKINVNDDRFKAVLDGNDGRFGIDKTDPNFKDTTSMREILNEQTKRRKNKRYKKARNAENDIVGEHNKTKTDSHEGEVSGANALSFLVRKLKSQVNR
mmetsp:Transcript_19831/g.46431  ORF Transcript_19831/g.46431 Transcript_19831/m.46431 type:complete len:763 (+) Transcript_19831:204-2492(+)|eukprot:CAMPEP_0197181296 /NCGR_PEP_ID=MMETSP1423-20130617/5625_1 /TAXON_ID=476441 /ORGANISM="Pseudo-nitzschia heimii, Strain UNC1101" /LENGTH=762 /DNA_ID=CAMNT_0042631525 /DNA_START=192 /DNA_END=2480 /DNA_ORIENTATION=+